MTKVDNANLPAKLELRRYFLNKYHSKGAIKVFDCCQGSGVIWNSLKEEYPISNYWGVDLKPKKGRLKIDSVRILQQPGLDANVIDIDTYGSPWKHWTAILPRISSPKTIFLTIGQWQMGTDSEMCVNLGLGNLKVSPGILMKLHELGQRYLISKGNRNGLKIVCCKESVSGGSPPSNAQYIGLHIIPEGPI